MRESIGLRLFRRLELHLYRHCRGIVCVTESFRNHLIRRGIDAAKIAVVTNGADLSRFAPRPKDESLEAQLGLRGKFVAGYVGTHGMAHGLETLLEAVAIAGRAANGSRIHLLLLGDGARKPQLKLRAAELGLTNVSFVDLVSKDEVPRYWSLLDVAIIHLRPTELFKSVIPSKLFECMAMGVPVLHGVLGESAEIVQRENAGIVFPPGDPAALSRLLVDLERNPAQLAALRAAARAAAPRYDRTRLAKEMLDALAQWSR
jgi:glycosyltransferase involved in cell wall biosynthesis